MITLLPYELVASYVFPFLSGDIRDLRALDTAYSNKLHHSRFRSMCKKLLSFFYYWQCSNTESVRVGRFLKLLIRGSCVSLSVCLSVCLSVIRKTLFFTTKEAQKNVAKIRKIFSIYTILLF